MKGQTLIEVLVALGVAVVVMTAISSAVITGLNNSQYSKLQNQATQYAQQGMEQMQNYRDAKSLHEFTGTTYKCLNAGCNPVTDIGASCFTDTTAAAVCPLIDNNFSRKVIAVHGVASCGGNVQINVKVEWSDGKCGATPCHRVDVSSCMLDSLRPSLGP
ncbi:hypothetical protein BH11PAT1_BH11PAT1_3140 [soil metagenome]